MDEPQDSSLANFDPIVRAIQATEPDVTVKGWSLDDQAKPEDSLARMQDLLRTHAVADRPYHETVANFQRYYPGVDPPTRDEYRKWTDRATLETKLEDARAKAQSEPLPGGSIALRRAVSFPRDLFTAADYALAKYHYKKGTASDRSLRDMALYEEEQRQRGHGDETWGGFLGNRLAELPSQAAGLYLGGVAAGGATPAALAAGTGIKAAVGRAAIQAAVTPNIGLQAAIHNNTEAGREPWDVRGLASGEALGLAQMLVLHGTGKLTEGSLAKLGLSQSYAANVLGQGLAGPLAQGATDVVTGALHLSTGYGNVEHVLGALEGKEGEGTLALKHALNDALTFAAFRALQGKPEQGRAVAAEAVRTAQDAHQEGLEAEAAAQRLREHLSRQQAAQPQGPTEVKLGDVDLSDLLPQQQPGPEAAQPQAAPVAPGSPQTSAEAPGGPNVAPQAPTQPEANPDAIRWKQPIGPDEPPLDPGMIRMYHGGILGGKGGRDFSPDRGYAEGYARKNVNEGAEVGYIDLPRDSPLLQKSYDDTGTSSPAPPVHLHAPADLAESMKPLKPKPPAAPERVDTLRSALKAVGYDGKGRPNAEKMKPEAVLAEARKLGIDQATERPPEPARPPVREPIQPDEPLKTPDKVLEALKQSVPEGFRVDVDPNDAGPVRVSTRGGEARLIVSPGRLAEWAKMSPERQQAAIYEEVHHAQRGGVTDPAADRAGWAALPEGVRDAVTKVRSRPMDDAVAFAEFERMRDQLKELGHITEWHSPAKRARAERAEEAIRGPAAQAAPEPQAPPQAAPTPASILESVRFSQRERTAINLQRQGLSPTAIAKHPDMQEEGKTLTPAMVRGFLTRGWKKVAAEKGESLVPDDFLPLLGTPGLTQREVTILSERFGRSLRDIAGELKLSGERIRQIENEAFAKLPREAIEQLAPGEDIQNVQDLVEFSQKRRAQQLVEEAEQAGEGEEDQSLRWSTTGRAKAETQTRHQQERLADQLDASLAERGKEVEDHRAQLDAAAERAGRPRSDVSGDVEGALAEALKAASAQAGPGQAAPTHQAGQQAPLRRGPGGRLRRAAPAGGHAPEGAGPPAQGDAAHPPAPAGGPAAGHELTALARAEKGRAEAQAELERAFPHGRPAQYPQGYDDRLRAVREYDQQIAGLQQHVAGQTPEHADVEAKAQGALHDGHSIPQAQSVSESELQAGYEAARAQAAAAQGPAQPHGPAQPPVPPEAAGGAGGTQPGGPAGAAGQQPGRPGERGRGRDWYTHDLMEDAGTPTSIKNAVAAEERAKAGLDPVAAADPVGHSYPELREQVLRIAAEEPGRIDALVERVKRNPKGAVTDLEDALLLHRQNQARNAYDRTLEEKVRADRGGDALDQEAARGAEQDARDALDEITKVAKVAGSASGRSLAARRMMVNEDFSLSALMMQLEAAHGRRLTPEEQQALVEEVARLRAALAAGNAVGAGRIRRNLRQQVGTAQAQNQGAGKRLESLLVKLRRLEVISGVGTLVKIAAASAERVAIAPLEEVAGAAWSRLPGLSKIAALAPREGRGLSRLAEQQAFQSSFTEGLKDSWATLRTGASDLDVLYGDTSSPRSWLDWVGELHAAAKAPAVRAEFTRSFLKRVDAELAAGRDATSPAAQLRLGTEAYIDAQRAKFQQDNWLVDSINKALAPGKDAGFVERAAKTTGRLLLPVVRIPTNLAFEVGTHIFGTATGTAGVVSAFVKGLDTLKPAEAETIMRNFKKGSLGLGLLAIGYALPGTFGGYYSGRRDENDVPAGAARIGGATVPSMLMHNPALEVLQFGATVRRAADKVVKGDKQGFIEGVASGTAGLLEEIPLVREAVDTGKLLNARERGHYFGNLAKSFAAPQFFQWLAGNLDKPTPFSPTQDPRQRQPETVLQNIETGWPGLRKRVPLK